MKGGQPGQKDAQKERSGFAEFFTSFSTRTAQMVGSYWAFLLAVGVVIVWGLTGPMFNYSDTWQLVINTGTTIVTFLMVFLIQNTQNRDTEALQVKLDELIRVTEGAHLVLLDLEELDDKQLDRIRDVYEKLASEAREKAKSGEDDTGTPDLGNDWMDEAVGEGQPGGGKGKKSSGKSKKSKG